MTAVELFARANLYRSRAEDGLHPIRLNNVNLISLSKWKEMSCIKTIRGTETRKCITTETPQLFLSLIIKMMLI